MYEPAIDAGRDDHPQARRYRDFRKLYDHAGEFDAVVVSTTEHTHAFATLPALQLGKHVYCEKPLTLQHLGGPASSARPPRRPRSPPRWEPRSMPATTTGASSSWSRPAQSGRCARCTSGSAGLGPAVEGGGPAAQGHRLRPASGPAARRRFPRGSTGICGSGPRRSGRFNEVYFPGPKWYRWWDFGNGTMSDLGSHWNDLPFWALKLQSPRTIEAVGPPPHPEIAPASMHVDLRIRPARRHAAGEAALVSGRRQAGTVADRRDPQVG